MPGRALTRYEQQLRESRLAAMRIATAVVVLLIAVAAVTTLWNTPNGLERVWQRFRSATEPTLSTGASFSLIAASFAREPEAASHAAALQATGLPAFVRHVSADRRYQVLVGPYVSTEEAEVAQRTLARRGAADTRVVVDDSLRHVLESGMVLRGSSDQHLEGAAVVVVPGPGTLSLVFEMDAEPRDVMARRVGATILELEVGPVELPVRPQAWSAPEGALLIREVSIGPSAGSASDGMLARLTVPESAVSNVRLVGRRVYVDLAWPPAPWSVSVTPPLGSVAVTTARRSADSGAHETASDADQIDTYRSRVAPVISRFQAIEPFLSSAAASPTPDVLSSLAPAIRAVSDSLSGVEVPAARARGDALLRSAIASAAMAVDPAFDGDRTAHAREAMALFEAASKQLDVSASTDQPR